MNCNTDSEQTSESQLLLVFSHHSVGLSRPKYGCAESELFFCNDLATQSGHGVGSVQYLRSCYLYGKASFPPSPSPPPPPPPSLMSSDSGYPSSLALLGGIPIKSQDLAAYVKSLFSLEAVISSSSVPLTDSSASARLQICCVRCGLLYSHPSRDMANHYTSITMPRASPPFYLCRSPHHDVHYTGNTGERELQHRTIHC